MSDSQYDTGIGPLMAKVLEQQREIARLTAERDEARKEVCIRYCDTMGNLFCTKPIDPQGYAEERGWDCFNTNTENQNGNP